jgi:anhydro-N-acetylmuramic acid kinase
VKVIGLMSGTSLDGIDVAVMEIRGREGGAPEWSLLSHGSYPYSDEQRAAILQVIQGSPAADLLRLHVELGEWLSQAVKTHLREVETDPTEVEVIGSHGQTIWHEPPRGDRRGGSLQLGDPATLAERTGISVVSDFRARDLAAGGHGAPLVPWADRILFAAEGRSRAIQNLGGMANVTWLPPLGDRREVVAFDTGPGVALLDAAARMATGGREAFDRDGELAAGGEVDEALLDRLMEIPFLSQSPPKSTGREIFGEALVRELSTGLPPGEATDGWPGLMATLTAFTARSIGEAYRNWVAPLGVDEVYLMGGGARNLELVRRITQELAPLPVCDPGALGMGADIREAAAFALLAWAHRVGIPANVPSATGSSAPRILGSLTPGAGEATGH